jgi:hypothetical protein
VELTPSDADREHEDAVAVAGLVGERLNPDEVGSGRGPTMNGPWTGARVMKRFT